MPASSRRYSPPPTSLAVAAFRAIVALLAATTVSQAATYTFLAAPAKDLNRVYRLDTLTGEVGACQFALNPGHGTIEPGFYGVTLCYPPGDGAGKQPPGEYALVSSRHEQEGGVFRVDLRTGAMSICYVYADAVVCTPQGK